jgi:predicted ATPase
VRPELPTGTVTFLFTDVEGSTKLLHEFGADAYAGALAEHRRIVREACAAERGVEVDTQGDAFFFAFPSAPGAVTAAQAMTEALAPGPIQLRIGLHTGTPLVTGEGYVGDDVHFAARVAASGHGGQVVLSQATRDLVDGVVLTDLGEHRLKDIESAVAIFQLGDCSFPPLKTISNTNLPRPASSFVGREAELDQVLSQLQGGARLLTLTGPGGSGKTRLALEAAATLVPSYKAGVFWVGLAPLRDAALVTETISQTIGSTNGLAEHIGDRELLLLIDNLEQVIDAAPELAALLPACPNLTLLCTSRELLRVQGEVEYEVPPLSSGEAVSLFCERSRLEPSKEIAELCARLDDLPLALELAAARTKVLSPAQILERLSQRLDLLRGGRDTDPRQQTLRATIEWSYGLLAEEEQRLFRALSVFAGGCTLEAAEEVAGASLDTLQSLVEKSLLRFTNERYWLLETIREYARERLAGAGEEPDLRRRHALFALDFADATEREVVEEGADQAVAFTRIGADLDNMRAAIEWARDSHADEVLLRLTAVLGFVLPVLGYDQEADAWIALALERASSPVKTRMHVLRAASIRAASARDYERSDAYVAEWRSLAEQMGDEDELLRAMNSAALNAGEQGKFDTARAQFVEIEARAREIGSHYLVAFAVVNLGEVAWRARDFRASLDYAAKALPLFRELRDDFGVASALELSGWSSLDLQDPVPARARFREALAVVARMGHKRRVAVLAAGLAASLVALHEEERAAQLLGAAASLLEEIGRGLEHELVEEIHERAVSDAKAALGEEAFAAAWARGEGMTVDEIVALAEVE